MKKFELLAATTLAMTFAIPAHAQIGSVSNTPAATTQTPPDPSPDDGANAEVVVTAQRRAETLQSVPIAVSAFTAEALDRQQIKNASDLQLTLPNVTFTKGNFTGSSFTIRGIGDLCVGVSCDSATAIHLNGSPLNATRLFETEYFDLERIEVLRGPQGTLFGRNATSGVVNFITAKPNFNGFSAQAEGEYGNYDSYKAKGYVNLPLTDTIALRVAGTYLNRNGYTKNLYDGSHIDGRDQYAVRGSLRWQPSSSTTIDLLGYYFHERDDRLRSQKQECQRDPTGVLGCLAGRRTTDLSNGNAFFTGVLTSAEFLRIRGIPTAFALGSLYGPDVYAAASPTNPSDSRVVNTDYTPKYFSDEQQYQARIEHDFGGVKAQLTGFYHTERVDSSQDYNLAIANRALYTAGLTTLAAAAAGGVPGLPASYFAPIATALIPNGPAGTLCTSLPVPSGTGAYGGNKLCGNTPLDFDRSNQKSSDYSGEAIISSDYDGAFNFLVGGIYSHASLSENSYYVNAFPIDYLSGILGSFTALGNPAANGGPLTPSYLGSPYFRNNTDQLTVKSYGLFGEVYVNLGDKLKLTGGIRYNNDRKYVRANSLLASFLVPYTATDVTQSTRAGGFDADPATTCAPAAANASATAGMIGSIAGCEQYQIRRVKYDKLTGRAVADYQFTRNNLLYASYSRGYKSGGINPPLQPIFAVPDSFAPESVDSYEVGSKNTFMNGKFKLNLTGFYYKYKNLQLSRIVARTAVNDNVDADIYGLEAEAVISPVRAAAINLGASYLHTKVSSDKFLSNPRDFGGGRADTVIIKDITNASNCAVVPTVAGNAAASNGFVTAVNTGLGLRGPTAFPADGGIASTGAFGICSVLAANAANPAAGVQVLNAGVAVNIRGNQLPQAPRYKFSAGAQYAFDLGGLSLVPRADLAYTGESYGSIFNRGPATRINRIQGYTQVNAQIQLNGHNDRWYVRGFIQNVFDSASTTGLAVGDQSSGLFTNIFTLEPRRYGIAAGVKF